MKIRRRPSYPSIAVERLTFQLNLSKEDQPQNILEEIVWHKDGEIEKEREFFPIHRLQKQLQVAPPVQDFREALVQSPHPVALIAEVKKASPSKGLLREDFDAVEIALAYDLGGADALSVLTDENFFQGSFENLARVREAVPRPTLCKDFILSPYQIYKARCHGADAILLIVAVLSDQDLKYLGKIARSLGMAVLVEVHDLEELDRALALEDLDLLGINNRNLEDFTVDLDTTKQLLDQRREILQKRDILVVSESGIHHPEDLLFLAKQGVGAVLVGESLVTQADPKQAVLNLLFRNP
ncbi:MAG: indole-3-glycerol phosphate synthase TrpC [Gloeobacterales cyanobacterium]